VYGLGQILEGMVLTPKIMGERIGLHPLVIIFALFVFGQIFGFFGVLMALPISAALSVLIRRVYGQYRRSDFYKT
jgi:predicted PurR-regulated permease PerM